MTRDRENLLLTAAFAVVTAAAVVASAGLSPVSRRAPLAVAVPTLALLALEIAGQISGARAGRRLRNLGIPGIASYVVGGRTKDEAAPPANGAGRRLELAMLGWACVLLASTCALGMAAGLPAFVYLYLRLQSGKPRRVAAGVAAGLWGVLYVVFVLALRIELFEGYLIPWAVRR
jgi:hypothetical protein